jgi:hypothetical protein
VYQAIAWILARREATSIVVKGQNFRAHFSPSAPRSPRWARWMTSREWGKVWDEAIGMADFSRRLARASDGSRGGEGSVHLEIHLEIIRDP